MDANWTSALARARAHSPYLSSGLDRLPALEALLAAGQGEAALDWVNAVGASAPDTGSALRREKLALSLALGIGDLAGAFTADRVTEELSDFADRALDSAIAAAIHAAHARCAARRFHRPGARQARRERTQLQLGHRSDPALRSGHCCPGASATSRARRRSGWPARWWRR
jgi:glutamine synthetase adenylyltransferase